MKIRPKDWKTLKYWLHLALIAVIILSILRFGFDVEMLNIETILLFTPLLGVADIIAHTVLQID